MPPRIASAAARPLSIACAIPSPCSGFTKPAASPTRRTRSRAGVVPTSPILSHAPRGRAGDGAGRTSAEHTDARRVFEERVEVARGASARGAIGEHTDAEADVRPPVARGEHPSVPRERCRAVRCPQHDVRDRRPARRGRYEPRTPTARGPDRRDRRPRRPDSSRRRRRRSRRLARDCGSSRRQREAAEPIVVADGFVGATVEELRAGRDRRRRCSVASNCDRCTTIP